MKISAIEEYGLRCLLQLARQAEAEQLMSAEDIARQEGLSTAYVEKILSQLRKAGLVKSVRGMYGGYKLSRAPQDIRVGDLMRAVDGDFFTDICQHFSGQSESCVHMNGCSVRPVWMMVARHVYRILDHLSLSDLLKEETEIEQALYREFPLPVHV
jgi:Rrf2 family transcriptional regulator, iron-sulfur cluster assembly transcription factor